MAEFFINKKNWNKVIDYAQSAYKSLKTEVGGMMVMHKDKDGDYILHDPVILKQEVSRSNCILDKEALAIYYGMAHKKHKNKGKTRFVWWHSHHTMAAFWSGTDVKTIEECETEDFSVSLVVNLKKEYKLRVQYFHPIMTDEDVELYITGEKKHVVPQAITDKVAELCTLEKKYGGVTTYKNGKKQAVTYEQRNMFSDEMINGEYNYGYGYSGHNPYDIDDDKYIAHGTLVTYMDGLNNQFCAGEIKYKTWKEALIKTNKALDEKECGWRLLVLPEKELEEVVYMAPPSQFLVRNTELLANPGWQK